MRTLDQPGPASEPRRIAMAVAPGGQFRVTLAEGEDYLTGLTQALADRGVTSAAIQVLGGCFAEMQYLTGQPDDSGQRVATYGAPTLLEGPVTIIGGNAILGHDADGEPLLHSHIVVADNQGQIHGGHVPPEVCPAGPGGVRVLVTVMAGGGFQVAPDEETNYSIFQPGAFA